MTGLRPDRAAVTRNGLPAPADYVYRGTGTDTMPWAQIPSWEMRALAERDAERAREAVDTQVRAARLRSSHPAYEPPPVPGVLNGLLVSPGEQLGRDLKRAERCGRCRYMTDAPGHRLMCGAS